MLWSEKHLISFVKISRKCVSPLPNLTSLRPDPSVSLSMPLLWIAAHASARCVNSNRFAEVLCMSLRCKLRHQAAPFLAAVQCLMFQSQRLELLYLRHNTILEYFFVSKDFQNTLLSFAGRQHMFSRLPLKLLNFLFVWVVSIQHPRMSLIKGLAKSILNWLSLNLTAPLV